MDWARNAKKIWPDSEIILFEAMEESEDIFQEAGYKYQIGVFSDQDDKEITFYKNADFPHGNSYYKENPDHSSCANAFYGSKDNEFKRRTITLDTAQKINNFPMPDLLKIDVQGCEIDILKGATNILKSVKHLIVELQHVEYNIGAQLADKSIEYIKSLGFELKTPKFSPSSHADADYHFIKS
jgi:FkbM family methyltransferase